MNVEDKDFTVDDNNQVLTTSLVVARLAGRRHADVLRTIDNIISEGFNESEENYYRPSGYRDRKGQRRRLYELTKDGFFLLASSFTGEKSRVWTRAFILKFIALEGHLRALEGAVVDCTLLAKNKPRRRRFSEIYH